jgi:adenine C2-methylase RlmN of 23S rRNA A2503 and tRNA A37
VINKNKLLENILMVKRPAGTINSDLPTQVISPKITRILINVINQKIPDFEDLEALNDHERNVLHKIQKITKFEGFVVPKAKTQSKQDKEIERFQILYGEICAGNDNKEIAKELKKLCLSLAKQNLIPKSQLNQIIYQLNLHGI